jgi:hypothetical protein
MKVLVRFCLIDLFSIPHHPVALCGTDGTGAHKAIPLRQICAEIFTPTQLAISLVSRSGRQD